MSANKLFNVELTEFQKKFLALAINAGALDTPVRVSVSDSKLTNARDMLDELEIIEYSHQENTVSIPSSSIEFLKQENIIDDSNGLTKEMSQSLTKVSEQHMSFTEFYKA